VRKTLLCSLRRSYTSFSKQSKEQEVQQLNYQYKINVVCFYSVSLLSTFYFVMFFSLRFYFYDTLDIFKVDFESWNGPNVMICNISFVLFCLPKPLIHSYLPFISISTFRRLHSHPLSLLLSDICSIPSSLCFTMTFPLLYSYL
jgi:hypothetical protein